MAKKETLWCNYGDGHEWKRQPTRGRKPVVCPEHREAYYESLGKPVPGQSSRSTKSSNPFGRSRGHNEKTNPFKKRRNEPDKPQKKRGRPKKEKIYDPWWERIIPMWPEGITPEEHAEINSLWLDFNKAQDEMKLWRQANPEAPFLKKITEAENELIKAKGLKKKKVQQKIDKAKENLATHHELIEQKKAEINEIKERWQERRRIYHQRGTKGIQPTGQTKNVFAKKKGKAKNVFAKS